LTLQPESRLPAGIATVSISVDVLRLLDDHMELGHFLVIRRSRLLFFLAILMRCSREQLCEFEQARRIICRVLLEHFHSTDGRKPSRIQVLLRLLNCHLPPQYADTSSVPSAMNDSLTSHCCRWHSPPSLDRELACSTAGSFRYFSGTVIRHLDAKHIM